MLVATLTALQTANTGYDMRQVLAIDVPPSATGVGDAATLDFFQEATRRIGELPGVQGVAAGMIVPWRDRSAGLKFQFAFEGYQPADGEENPTCRFRPVSPRFFAVLGVPILAGRDFTDEDRRRHRARRHRQPERGTAPVPERRRGQPTSVVRDVVESHSPAASSASSRTWMTRTSCRSRR